MRKKFDPETWSNIRSEFERLREFDREIRERELSLLHQSKPAIALEVGRLLRADQVVDDSFLVSPMPSAPNQAPLSEGLVFGGFELKGVLGTGGMGTVYRARQLNPDREVALKVLRFALSTDVYQRRFQYEAQLLGRLTHPGIAQVYGSGLEEIHGVPTPWFAMELVQEARPLTAYVREKGLDWQSTVRLYLSVLDAIQHAHQRGVIHRDIKSANLLVDRGGHVKVIDFGVASFEDGEAELTRAGELVGTVATMSPEQLEVGGDAADVRSDVYSAGVVLYTALCGEPPHDLRGLSLAQATRLILESRCAKLSSHGVDAPEDLDWVLARAMERDPEDRYGSAAEFRAELIRVLEQAPVEAGPPTRSYRLKKFYERNRLVVLGALTTFLALLLGFVGTAMGWHRAAEAKQVARTEAQNALDASLLAQAQKKQAEEESLLSERVVQFLLAGLRSPDPDRDGREWTMVEFLEREAATVGDEFADHPRLRGRLEVMIGCAYYGLGLLDESEGFLERGVESLSASPDTTAHELLAAQRNRVQVLVRSGRRAAAQALIDQVRDELGETLENPGYDSWVFEGTRAMTLLERGEYDKGRALLSEAIAGLEPFAETVGDAVEVMASWESELAGSYHRVGEFHLAAEHYERAIELSESKVDPEDPNLMRLRSNLAVLAAQLGEPNRAIELLGQVLEIQDRTLGSDHMDSIGTRCNLGGLYFLANRAAEAKEVWEEVIEALGESASIAHPLRQAVTVNLGTLAVNDGRLEEAKELLYPVHQLRLEELGVTDGRTTAVGYELARAHLKLEEYEAAYEYCDEVFSALDGKRVGTPMQHLNFWLLQIETLWMLEEEEEAQAYWQQLSDEIAAGEYDAVAFDSLNFGYYVDLMGVEPIPFPERK